MASQSQNEELPQEETALDVLYIKLLQEGRQYQAHDGELQVQLSERIKELEKQWKDIVDCKNTIQDKLKIKREDWRWKPAPVKELMKDLHTIQDVMKEVQPKMATDIENATSKNKQFIEKLKNKFLCRTAKIWNTFFELGDEVQIDNKDTLNNGEDDATLDLCQQLILELMKYELKVHEKENKLNEIIQEVEDAEAMVENSQEVLKKKIKEEKKKKKPSKMLDKYLDQLDSIECGSKDYIASLTKQRRKESKKMEKNMAALNEEHIRSTFKLWQKRFKTEGGDDAIETATANAKHQPKEVVFSICDQLIKNAIEFQLQNMEMV